MSLYYVGKHEPRKSSFHACRLTKLLSKLVTVNKVQHLALSDTRQTHSMLAEQKKNSEFHPVGTGM